MAYIFDVAGSTASRPRGRRWSTRCPPARGADRVRAGRDRAGPARFTEAFRRCSRGDRGRAAQRAARGRDVGPGDDLGGAGRPAGRADRARPQLPADPALVARLRESQVPLEVCPTSNVCTRQVPGLAGHPLPRMLEAGLFVTLNSDDPPMFGTTLTGSTGGRPRCSGWVVPSWPGWRPTGCGRRSWTRGEARRCWQKIAAVAALPRREARTGHGPSQRPGSRLRNAGGTGCAGARRRARRAGHPSGYPLRRRTGTGSGDERLAAQVRDGERRDGGIAARDGAGMTARLAEGAAVPTVR